MFKIFDSYVLKKYLLTFCFKSAGEKKGWGETVPHEGVFSPIQACPPIHQIYPYILNAIKPLFQILSNYHKFCQPIFQNV